MASLVADYVRTNKQAIANQWERDVSINLKPLARLSRPALLDHLPEVLDALCAWIESTPREHDRHFDALADGHALQRLGFGIELDVLTREYSYLRSVLQNQLMAVHSTPQVRLDLIRLDEGLDLAIFEAVRRYVQRRDQIRDRFIGILGHDLRNPLSTIVAAVHVLQKAGDMAAREAKSLEVIARATQRMSRMVNDVLDFARGHLGGGIPTKLVKGDMGEICRAAADEIQTAHPSRVIDLRAEGDLSGTFDRDRLLQSFGNLLSNAIQHGEDPIEMLVSEASDHRAIVTSVINRGPAIPQAVLSNLFDPFVAASTNHAGLGLGLYIVAEIARAHGATYDVSSSQRETRFVIRWPRTPRSEMPERT
jgi:signal transduction histidine kinase